MSAELRLKKLRGSGGFIMARVTDEQQSKGNLGGPDPVSYTHLTLPTIYSV